MSSWTCATTSGEWAFEDSEIRLSESEKTPLSAERVSDGVGTSSVRWDGIQAAPLPFRGLSCLFVIFAYGYQFVIYMEVRLSIIRAYPLDNMRRRLYCHPCRDMGFRTENQQKRRLSCPEIQIPATTGQRSTKNSPKVHSLRAASSQKERRCSSFGGKTNTVNRLPAPTSGKITSSSGTDAIFRKRDTEKYGRKFDSGNKEDAKVGCYDMLIRTEDIPFRSKSEHILAHPGSRAARTLRKASLRGGFFIVSQPCSR